MQRSTNGWKIGLALCLVSVLSAGLWPTPSVAENTTTTEARLSALIEELVSLLETLPEERRDAIRDQIDQRLQELADVEAAASAAVPTAPAVSPPSAAPAQPPAVAKPTIQAQPSRHQPKPQPPATPAPAQPPAPAETEPEARPALRCELAVPLDSDDDRQLTAFDRYWRHLYLWTDVDGDGDLDEREVESPYERGIRSIDLGLRSFVRGKGKRQRTLDITVDQRVIFDVGGNGFDGPLPRRDDGALVLDATAIREQGGPELRSAEGERLDGLHALRPGQQWILTDGEAWAPACR